MCGRCRGVVVEGVCCLCGSQTQTYGFRSNLTRQRRGYDAMWQRVRCEAIRRATVAAAAAGVWLGPLCAFCGEPVADRDIHVDHIHGFDGPADPKRLDLANLRVCHARCHMRHEASSKGTKGSKGK